MSEYWQEDINDDANWQIPPDVIDSSFRLIGKTIQVDHAWVLSQSTKKSLPWYVDDDLAALHLIHVAESANGWQRPEGAREILHMSRRTRLYLRLPGSRLQDAAQLKGKTLYLGTEPIKLGDYKVRSLSKSAVIFARYLDMQDNVNESLFLEKVRIELEEKRIFARKMLCGRVQTLQCPSGDLITRSLMLADLPVKDSVKLQQVGLGGNRKIGCGVFIAHKGIDAVGGQQENK